MKNDSPTMLKIGRAQEHDIGLKNNQLYRTLSFPMSTSSLEMQKLPELPRFEFGSIDDVTQASLLGFTALVSAYLRGGAVLTGAFEHTSCVALATEVGDDKTKKLPMRPIEKQPMPKPTLATLALFSLLAHYGAPLSHTTAFQFDLDNTELSAIPHKDTATYPKDLESVPKIHNVGFSVISDLAHTGTFVVHEESTSKNLDTLASLVPVSHGVYRRTDGVLLRQQFPGKPATVHSAISEENPADSSTDMIRKAIVTDHMSRGIDHLTLLEGILRSAAGLPALEISWDYQEPTSETKRPSTQLLHTT